MQSIGASIGIALVILLGGVAFATAQSTSTTPLDSLLQRRAATRIARAPDLRHDAINVVVTNRVITLTGSVDARYKKPYAARLARINGIVRVDNQLRVKRPSNTVTPNTHGAITPPPIK